MRPSVFIAVLFSVLGLFVLVFAGAFAWAVTTTESPRGQQYALLLAAASVVVFLLAFAWSWVLIQLRLLRPIEALTREVQTLAHVRKMRQIEMPDGHLASGLVHAVQSLVAKFIDARATRQQAVDAALARGNTYKRRLETILLDLSEGVIVCNLDNRVLLYNQAAVEILDRPVSLGLGRSLFTLFERDAVTAAVNELKAKQRADKKRKLRITRTVSCARCDSGDTLEAQLALICSDNVQTEGYVLTFSPPAGARRDMGNTLPPRPEFYDFDLFDRQFDCAVTDIPLNALHCVVFDTETTGLKPSQGDELVSIGAVRVVNGRIVSGETFEQLIDPGMKIPESSIRFHGITDGDVKGMPGANAVLPRFHQFCSDDVLVAHNAAFDMKFLELKEKASGISFTNPVLDVLLLSAFLHDHARDHSLNAVARRLGVEVANRHTALGDATATAGIFLAMLEPLAERGVVTLADALKVSSQQVEVRKMQAAF